MLVKISIHDGANTYLAQGDTWNDMVLQLRERLLRALEKEQDKLTRIQSLRMDVH